MLQLFKIIASMNIKALFVRWRKDTPTSFFFKYLKGSTFFSYRVPSRNKKFNFSKHFQISTHLKYMKNSFQLQISNTQKKFNFSKHFQISTHLKCMKNSFQGNKKFNFSKPFTDQNTIFCSLLTFECSLQPLSRDKPQRLTFPNSQF